MKVGLVGYSGSGKSTIFTWLTGVAPDPAVAQRGQTGVARIPDTRLAWLSDPANWTDPRNGILLRLWEHISLSAVALGLAVAIGLPLGLWIGHTGRGSGAVIAIANIGRAVPSVGWLGLVFPITLVILGRGGLGFIPAVIALTLLGIPPIVTNTFAGMREVDPDLIEAGRGMGMTARQVVRRVEVPVALPVILAGVRVSAVQIVATATLAKKAIANPAASACGVASACGASPPPPAVSCAGAAAFSFSAMFVPLGTLVRIL